MAYSKCFYFYFCYSFSFEGKTPIYFTNEVNSSISLENNDREILKEMELNSLLLLYFIIRLSKKSSYYLIMTIYN